MSITWIVTGALVCAIATTSYCLLRDKGHRCFAVRNRDAAIVIVRILENLAGLRESFTFDAGPTHQTVLKDGTVIMYVDEVALEYMPAPNGFSVVVHNPRGRAWEAAQMLKRAGFTATVDEYFMPELGGDKFVLLSSNAFLGWTMAFRRHFIFLGRPPNKRKLLAK